jgi:hypothetical protein
VTIVIGTLRLKRVNQTGKGNVQGLIAMAQSGLATDSKIKITLCAGKWGVRSRFSLREPVLTSLARVDR